MSAKKKSKPIERLSLAVTKAVGRPAAVILAFIVVITWGVSGFLFNFSENWQLFINSFTTIITFLMVFIIQQTQNKDAMAMQLKLNELIAADAQSSNRLVDIEDLTEEEILVLKNFYVHLAKLAKKETELHTSHSIDEAGELHKKTIRNKK